MNSSARMSNLRALLADDDDLRRSVINTVRAFESIEKEDSRGFRRANLLDSNAPTHVADPKAVAFELEDEPYQALCSLLIRDGTQASFPRRALAVDEIATGGVSYGTRSSSKYRNSNIMFKCAQIEKAGVIEVIFRYSYHQTTPSLQEITEYFLIVWEYCPINDNTLDIFSAVGFTGGFLRNATPTELHVIPLTSVVSHFALTRMSEAYSHTIHVLPVDRVGLAQSRFGMYLPICIAADDIIQAGWCASFSRPGSGLASVSPKGTTLSP